MPVETAGQVRAGLQPRDREGAAPRNPRGAARARRSGDRMKVPFAAVHSSGFGPRLPTRRAPVHGSYRTNTGNVILALSISAHDPFATSVSRQFRNAPNLR